MADWRGRRWGKRVGGAECGGVEDEETERTTEGSEGNKGSEAAGTETDSEGTTEWNEGNEDGAEDGG